jgi:hypothetical protein
LDRTDFRNGPSRPASIDYPGRLSTDGGDMFSQQRTGHYRNLKINRDWFEHQRSNGAAPERHQPAPEKAAPEKQRENRRADLHPPPERAPAAAAPEREQVRIELRHGFNPGVPVSRPENQVRRSYDQQPQRDNSATRNQMREAARETLRRNESPARPEARELNRAPETARGLER